MFPVSYRLKGKKIYQLIYRKGRATSTKHFAVRQLLNQTDRTRLALNVSIKVSKQATVRNTVKRRIRAAIQPDLSQLRKGVDFILSAKPGSQNLTAEELTKEVSSLLGRARLIARKR